MICPNCNGYGSSMKEEDETCTTCGGSGLRCDKCSSPVEAFYNRGSHFDMDLCVGCRGEDQESPYFIEVHADWQPPKKSIVEINITL